MDILQSFSTRQAQQQLLRCSRAFAGPIFPPNSQNLTLIEELRRHNPPTHIAQSSKGIGAPSLELNILFLEYMEELCLSICDALF